jgi:hypothetical protein
MIYRRVTTNIIGYYGIADLGFVFLMPVDFGKRYIWGGYNMSEVHDDASSSGVTICNGPGSGQLMTIDVAEKLIIHETSHKFYGEGHFVYNWAFLGLMSSANGGEGMQSFERAILGYIKFIKIDSTLKDLITLKDYMTTGEAGIITVPDWPNQFYILENRQKLSQYDGAPSPGLFIYLLFYNGEYSTLDIQSADGKWDWKLDSTKKLVKVYPNPVNGKSHLEIVNINGVNYYPPEMNGNSYDAFKQGYKTLYAPWTNPCSNAKINNIQDYSTNISVNLTDQVTSTLKIKVSFDASRTGIGEVFTDKRTELKQNYPNPFNSSTQIQYLIANPSLVKLEILNILGESVCMLIDRFQSTGKYTIEFNPKSVAGGLPSGVYFYRLFVRESGDSKNLTIDPGVKNLIETKKFILMK